MDSYVATEHFKNLVKKSKILNDSLINNKSGFHGDILASHCIETHNLSLREVETLVRNIEIYHVITDSFKKLDGTVTDRFATYCNFNLLAICLYTIQPHLAKNILRDKSDALAIANFLGEDSIFRFTEEYSKPKLHEVLCVFLGSECKINAERFAPHDNNWSRIYDMFFEGFTPGKGQILKEFTQALSNLSLNATMVSISRD